MKPRPVLKTHSPARNLEVEADREPVVGDANGLDVQSRPEIADPGVLAAAGKSRRRARRHLRLLLVAVRRRLGAGSPDLDQLLQQIEPERRAEHGR